MPRIELITDKAQVSEDRHAEMDAIVATLHRVGGPFGVMLYSPGLAQKVMEAGAHIRLNSTLSQLERELTIMAVSREKDAAYEWAAHVNIARTAGLPEEVVEAVRNSGDVSGFDPDQRDIVLFVRQLLQKNRVEQGLFDSLVERKGVRWLVELAGTVGQYQYISAINNTFGLEPAEGADKLPV